MFWFLLWIALSVLVGKLADDRGRSFGGFMVLSILISPIFAGIILLIAGEKK